jgi:hypothetical protein
MDIITFLQQLLDNSALFPIGRWPHSSVVSNSHYEHFLALLAKMWEVYCLELIFCFIRLPQSQNYCYGI